MVLMFIVVVNDLINVLLKGIIVILYTPSAVITVNI